MSTKIKPFWLQIHQFIVFPLYPAAVMLIGLIGCMMLTIMSLEDWRITLASFAPAMLVFLIYNFSILDSSMQGFDSPPSLFKAKDRHQFEPLLKESLFIMILLAGLLYSALFYKTWINYALWSLSILILPAMIMTLGISRSILDAINPLKITSVIVKVQKSYSIMLGILFLFQAGIVAFIEIAHLYLPKLMVMYTAGILVLYHIFVLFRMMGYILYQNHEKLEHGGVKKDDEPIQEKSNDPELQIINQCLKEGQHEKAIEIFTDIVKAQPENISIRDKYQKILLQFKKEKLLFEHTRGFLKELVKQHQNAKALDYFAQVVQQYPHYHMKDVDITAELVKTAQLLKREKLIVPLTNQLHVSNGTNPQIVPLYLLMADSLFYFHANKQAAIEILQFLLIKYSSHPKKVEIKKKLDLFLSE